MPLSIGIQGALEEVAAELLPGEQLSAFLDDVYLLCDPSRLKVLYELLEEALSRVAGIQLHQGKTRVWNRAHGGDHRRVDVVRKESPLGRVIKCKVWVARNASPRSSSQETKTGEIIVVAKMARDSCPTWVPLPARRWIRPRSCPDKLMRCCQRTSPNIGRHVLPRMEPDQPSSDTGNVLSATVPASSGASRAAGLTAMPSEHGTRVICPVTQVFEPSRCDVSEQVCSVRRGCRGNPSSIQTRGIRDDRVF